MKIYVYDTIKPCCFYDIYFFCLGYCILENVICIFYSFAVAIKQNLIDYII